MAATSDVGAADLAREVARARVADRHGRVPLEQQQRDRLADQEAPADDDGARAAQRDARSRRAGASPRAACTAAVPARPRAAAPGSPGAGRRRPSPAARASITACASSAGGSGSWTRMPCTRRSAPSDRTSAEQLLLRRRRRQAMPERLDARPHGRRAPCSRRTDATPDRRRPARSPAPARCRARRGAPPAPGPRPAPPPPPPCRRSSVPRASFPTSRGFSGANRGEASRGAALC